MSSTTENYLKHIYLLSGTNVAGKGNALVGLGALADIMKVTPGSVTSMMKTLQRAGLVDYRPRNGAVLTEQGQREALDIVRRHRLIELFLVQIIGLDWKYVHAEAEVLEHVFSKRLLDRIDELLAYPSVDPHGDPIPAANGVMPQQKGMLLSDVTAPCQLTITRVNYHQESFLDFLGKRDLVPGATITLVDRDTMAGTLTITRNDTPLTISLKTATLISVAQKPI